MNRLLLIVLISFIAPVVIHAQTSLTFSYDGVGLYSGARLKYAYSFPYTQVGVYASAISFYGTYGTGPTSIGGLCINSVPDRNKNVGVYAGGSIEYIVTPKTGYTERSYVAGPQLGLIIKLAKHLALNPEWGLRLGAMKTRTEYYSPGGAHYFVSGTSPFIYFPASIGCTYTFHRKDK